ncbi:MAG: hypothetical protein M0R74_14940 [Dehalococcoidia bacterium]|nr:hypothetical protein [Dehalococcoidia bacterium]
MKRFSRGPRLLPALLALPFLLFATAGCVGYPAQGLIATPTAPGQNAPSRLPQLLSQLQGGSAGLELFDQATSEVAAAQDEATATQTPTPPGGKLPGDDSTPPPGGGTPTPTATNPPGNGGTPTPPGTETPTETPTATPTETETPAPTEPPAEPTPTPTIPSEQTPPTEE